MARYCYLWKYGNDEAVEEAGIENIYEDLLALSAKCNRPPEELFNRMMVYVADTTRFMLLFYKSDPDYKRAVLDGEIVPSTKQCSFIKEFLAAAIGEPRQVRVQLSSDFPNNLWVVVQYGPLSMHPIWIKGSLLSFALDAFIEAAKDKDISAAEIVAYMNLRLAERIDFVALDWTRIGDILVTLMAETIDESFESLLKSRSASSNYLASLKSVG